MKSKVLILPLIYFLSGFLLFYRITSSPPGLHGDELGYTYNAYSLLKTGKDEYGKFLPLTFRNDFDPLVVYLYIIPTLLFGLNDAVTKIFTASAGVMVIWIMYRLVKLLFNNQKLAILTIILITISSWQLRISRLSVSNIWALLFQLTGIWLFFRFIKKRKNLFLSFIFFGFSVITFPSAKVTTPLILLFLFYQYRSHFKNKFRIFFIYFILFILLPIFIYFTIRPLSEMRFSGITILLPWKNSLAPDESLFSIRSLIRLIQIVITNYLNNFNPKILFLNNNGLRYYQLKNLGLFYLWQFPFILIGLYGFIKKFKNKIVSFILYILIISPIPASLTTGIPYANVFRNLLSLPFIELICAFGICLVINKSQKHKIIKQIIMFLIILSCGIYSHQFLYQYYVINSQENFIFWGKPFKDTMPLVISYENSVNKIIITNPYHQSYMYYLFYGKKDPVWLQTQVKSRDRIVGYDKIANYEFRSVNWDQDKNLPNSLLVGLNNEIPANISNIIYEYKDTYTDEALLRIVKTD